MTMIPDEKTLPLVPIAFRIATDPAFVENLRHQSSNPTSEDFQFLDPEEQLALRNLLEQEEVVQTLRSSADDAPTDGYWWNSHI